VASTTRTVGGLAILLLSISSVTSGQAPAGLPSTAKGDWIYYNADLTGSKYSPLDQINAANFNQLEVAWRFKTDMLGPRPEYKLEGTPVAVNGVLYTTAKGSAPASRHVSSRAGACRTGPTARATSAFST
jgi:quinoprotein glucose dehydrogenase